MDVEVHGWNLRRNRSVLLVSGIGHPSGRCSALRQEYMWQRVNAHLGALQGDRSRSLLLQVKGGDLSSKMAGSDEGAAPLEAA
jgi:hypothetical protein